MLCCYVYYCRVRLFISTDFKEKINTLYFYFVGRTFLVLNDTFRM